MDPHRQGDQEAKPFYRDRSGAINELSGPWPFITRCVYHTPDHLIRAWSSRHHRKGIPYRDSADGRTMRVSATGSIWRCCWMPRHLNWWIGVVFALGSLLFALASVMSLAPSLAHTWSLDSSAINSIFFSGSIPFTAAAYLQLYQAANSETFPVVRVHAEKSTRKRFGWKPRDIGWLSCVLQFAGTLFFNINTLDALLPEVDWFQQDLMVWTPDFVGSMLFLVSGYLAFAETCHMHWAWKPASISWWVVFINLSGCIGFMISAIFAFKLPGGLDHDAVTISLVFTLLGAVGFFAGSLLMLPESITPAK